MSEAVEGAVAEVPATVNEGEQASAMSADGGPESGPRGESGEGRRRGRGRDRQRRDRMDEAGTDGAVASADAPVELNDASSPVAAHHDDESVPPASVTAPFAAAAVAAVHVPASRHAAVDPIAGTERALPATRHAVIDPIAGTERSAPIEAAVAVAPTAAFDLPVDSLQAVAESAGLQWVNSDTDKIRAVQAAMAAEAKPAHVPRERKVAAVADDGPLVLVETRKDLSQIKLPFETAQGAQQPQP